MTWRTRLSAISFIEDRNLLTFHHSQVWLRVLCYVISSCRSSCLHRIRHNLNQNITHLWCHDSNQTFTSLSSPHDLSHSGFTLVFPADIRRDFKFSLSLPPSAEKETYNQAFYGLNLNFFIFFIFIFFLAKMGLIKTAFAEFLNKETQKSKLLYIRAYMEEDSWGEMNGKKY